MSRRIYDPEALRRYLREQDQADAQEEISPPPVAELPSTAAPKPTRRMRFVSEHETDTAIYRQYESECGRTRMELVTTKETVDAPALAYRVELPRLAPGNAAAQAAFKQGLEDEYIEGMKARYGGEW